MKITWEERIKKRVEEKRNCPPLDELERITTTIAEVIAADLSYKLLACRKTAISANHIIDNSDLLNQDFHFAGLQPFILTVISDELLQHEQRLGSASRMGAAQKEALGKYANLLSDADDREVILDMFIRRFPQLADIGLGTPAALEDYVINTTREHTRNTLQGKPSVRITPKPESEWGQGR